MRTKAQRLPADIPILKWSIAAALHPEARGSLSAAVERLAVELRPAYDRL